MLCIIEKKLKAIEKSLGLKMSQEKSDKQRHAQNRQPNFEECLIYPIRGYTDYSIDSNNPENDDGDGNEYNFSILTHLHQPNTKAYNVQLKWSRTSEYGLLQWGSTTAKIGQLCWKGFGDGRLCGAGS